MDKKSIRNFSLGSYLIFGHFTNNKYIDKTDDDDNRRKIAMNFNKFNNKNEMIINLNVSAGDKKGIYTLKIIPHYNNDRTSTNFNLIVKLDYKNKMSGIKTNGKLPLFFCIILFGSEVFVLNLNVCLITYLSYVAA